MGQTAGRPAREDDMTNWRPSREIQLERLLRAIIDAEHLIAKGVLEDDIRKQTDGLSARNLAVLQARRLINKKGGVE